MADKNTPPAELLDVRFDAAPIAAVLHTVISYNGPGSWKRNALWDEYVVTLQNRGSAPLTISSAALVDYAGASVPSGSHPWDLEASSRTLEQKYREAGVTFVRTGAPVKSILIGTGATIAASGAMSVAAEALSAVTIFAWPVYTATAITINHRNKAAVEREFARRSAAMPLTIAPGESRSVSLFFPMVREPAKLDLMVESPGTTTSLPLDFLKGFHVAPAKP